ANASPGASMEASAVAAWTKVLRVSVMRVSSVGVVGRSVGARTLVRALQQLADRGAFERPRVGVLVLHREVGGAIEAVGRHADLAQRGGRAGVAREGEESAR